MIYDSETCNLNLAWRGNLPWQHAFLIATKDQILEEHNYYVKWPNLKVSKDAARITGFSPEKVARLGRDPKEVCDIIDSYFYNPEYKIVIHNGLNFDIYVHNIHRLEVGKETDYSYVDRLYDSNYLVKGYKHGIQPRRDESLLAYQYKLCNVRMRGIKTSIATLCKEYEIKHEDGAHDAIVDVKMLFQIWKKVINQVEI